MKKLKVKVFNTWNTCQSCAPSSMGATIHASAELQHVRSQRRPCNHSGFFRDENSCLLLTPVSLTQVLGFPGISILRVLSGSGSYSYNLGFIEPVMSVHINPLKLKRNRNSFKQYSLSAYYVPSTGNAAVSRTHKNVSSWKFDSSGRFRQ